MSEQILYVTDDTFEAEVIKTLLASPETAITVTINYKDMYDADDKGNPYSPSWWTLNFKVSYKIIEQLSIDLGIENIFNERYRPYSSGIASPGRNFIIAVRASL